MVKVDAKKHKIIVVESSSDSSSNESEKEEVEIKPKKNVEKIKDKNKKKDSTTKKDTPKRKIVTKTVKQSDSEEGESEEEPKPKPKKKRSSSRKRSSSKKKQEEDLDEPEEEKPKGLNLKLGQELNIKGKVISVKDLGDGRASHGKEMKLFAQKSGLILTARYHYSLQKKQNNNYKKQNNNYTAYEQEFDFFRPDKGDAVSGPAVYKGNQEFEFTSEPLVEISADQASIIKVIEKSVKNHAFRHEEATRLYEKLVSLAQDNDNEESTLTAEQQDTSNVINLLNELSSSYVKLEADKNYPVTNRICPRYMTEGDFWGLLGTWHQQRIVRQLYLLGLTDEEMANACYYHCIGLPELYAKCRDNPNSICILSKEKVQAIIDKTDRRPTSEEARCGVIMRSLYFNLDTRNHNCVNGNGSNTMGKHIKIGYNMNQIDSKWRDLLPMLTGKIVANEDPDESEESKESRRFDMVYDDEYNTCYIKKVHQIETELADDFRTLVKQDPLIKYYHENQKFPEAGEKSKDFDREHVMVDNAIGNKEANKQLIHEQIVAIQGCMDHQICNITGGAGVGKTTVINAIVKCLDHREIVFYLTSFTGCAVSVIKKKVPNIQAYTIHRLINTIKKLDPKKGLLPTRIIVDESSMVSLPLFHRLVQTIRTVFGEETLPRFTFIGDNNQLPPIEWGSMFQSLIESGIIPSYVLLHNHRVDENPEDGIVINASSMINNLHSKDNEKNKYSRKPIERFNFAMTPNFVINEATLETLYAYIEQLYEDGVPLEDIRVLSPYVIDLNDINKHIQKTFLFQNKYVKDSRGNAWYVNDIVMMNKNNYDIDVMNGETGVIIEITRTNITVKFSEVKIASFALEPPRKHKTNNKFSYNIFGEKGDDTEMLSVLSLKLSYATTVHSSQGGEKPIIIFWIPFGKSNSGTFFNCNLTYVAITRAQKSFIALGDVDAMIESTKYPVPFRNSRLTERLEKGMKKIPLITHMDQDLDIKKLPRMFLTAAQEFGFEEETGEDLW